MTTAMTDVPVAAPRYPLYPEYRAPQPAKTKRRRRTMEPLGLRYILLAIGLVGAAGPIGQSIVAHLSHEEAETQAIRSSAWNGGSTGLISGEREHAPGLDVNRIQNFHDDQRGVAREQFMPARSRD